MPDLVTLGTLVIIAGILVVFLATIFASRSRGDDEEKGIEVKGGGVIMIGPIPIIFGTDPKWAVVAIVLAIVLIVLSLFLGRAL
jgi:uncharacterized protein (TIGR00304 family)